MKPRQRELHFLPLQPTSDILGVGGAILSLSSLFFAAKQSSPQQTIHANLFKCPFETLLVSCILALGVIGWFQDCIMRRIRRSDRGQSSVRLVPDLLFLRQSAFCAHPQAAPSECLSQRPESTRKTKEYSSSADLLASLLFLHFFECLCC